jgi:hypothetical protein
MELDSTFYRIFGQFVLPKGRIHLMIKPYSILNQWKEMIKFQTHSYWSERKMLHKNCYTLITKRPNQHQRGSPNTA